MLAEGNYTFLVKKQHPAVSGANIQYSLQATNRHVFKILFKFSTNIEIKMILHLCLIKMELISFI